MILAFILVLVVMNGINRTLAKLEHKQKILCYDMQILNKQMKKEELAYLRY